MPRTIRKRKIKRISLNLWWMIAAIVFSVYQVRMGIRYFDSINPLTGPPSPKSSPKCRCVECEVDNACGGLWSGRLTKNETDVVDPTDLFNSLVLVVSHCASNLTWLNDFIEDVGNGKDGIIREIRIYSKCGKEVVGAPPNSSTFVLPNVGRCDHTYAHYIESTYRNDRDSSTDRPSPDDEVVVFLKDTRMIHQLGKWRSFSDVLVSVHRRGFGCVLDSSNPQLNVSDFHFTEKLVQFNMSRYDHRSKLYGDVNTTTRNRFVWKHSSLGEYMKSLDYSPPQSLTQVCYGGNFAATRRAIRRQPRELWESMRRSLMRGDNIVEGHYVERSWAGLLADPISDLQITALKQASYRWVNLTDSRYGALEGRKELFMEEELLLKKETRIRKILRGINRQIDNFLFAIWVKIFED